MKAIVYTEYGSPEVLRLAEVSKPVPQARQVLIKIHATNAAASEALGRRGESLVGRIIMGLRKPRKRFRILGMELAGEIEAVGKAVTRFKPGDQVYGFTGFRQGTYAEYTCMPETGSLALKPTNLTYVEAAAVVDGATTALHFLRDMGKIQRGQKVLIIGASGCIGTCAVQLASYFGAEVTGVCSTANVELVRSLKADRVVDYTREDFTKSGETYDIIFDTVGKSSFARCKGALTKNGCYLVTNGTLLINFARMVWTSLIGGKRFLFGFSIEKAEALVFLKELIEAGKITPVIDRCYSLEQIVEAHRYVDTGHKKGNVVITVGPYSTT
jgi:NADPH:quinone reductase-like Zn-dependent oxidoreductase